MTERELFLLLLFAVIACTIGCKLLARTIDSIRTLLLAEQAGAIQMRKMEGWFYRGIVFACQIGLTLLGSFIAYSILILAML